MRSPEAIRAAADAVRLAAPPPTAARLPTFSADCPPDIRRGWLAPLLGLPAPPLPVYVLAIADMLTIRVHFDAAMNDPSWPREERIDGALARGRLLTLIRIDATLPLRRQRFTLAHEVGHYLLHDADFETSQHARYVETPEREANHFAAELLMPVDEVERAVGCSRSFIALCRVFGVSKQAMSYRLAELGLQCKGQGTEDPAL